MIPNKCHWVLLLSALFAPLLWGGCSSSSSCKKACTKINSCYGETGAGQTCPLSSTCDKKQKCKAQCILDAPCEAILGKEGAEQNIQEMAQCMEQCNSIPTSDGANVNNDGGVVLFDGKMADYAFLDQSARDAVLWDYGLKRDHSAFPDHYVYADRSLYPDQYVYPDQAWYQDHGSGVKTVAKFCNAVQINQQDVTVTLKVGANPGVTMSAFTGQCSSPLNSPCSVLPTGQNIPIEVTQNGQQLATGSIANIPSGEQWVIILSVSESDPNKIELIGGAVKSPQTCSSIDPFTPPPSP